MLLDIGENVDLVYCAFLKFFVFLKPADLNDFDCILFGIELVSCPIDLSVGSLTNYFVQCVVFDDSNHFDN